jgi:hypothetical protein
MDLQVVHNLVNFLLNKAQGAWYSPEDIDDLILDPGQISLYNDYYSRYATTQRLDDALAPFKAAPFVFTNGTTPDGLVNTPADYFDLLDIYTLVTSVTNVTTRKPCPAVEEDEVTYRMNSQIDPNSTSNPFCRITTNWDIQLYPNVPQTGVMTYLRRPVKPFFSYTLLSGRLIVYNAGLSTQLEWGDTQILSVVIKGLGLIGINIGEQDIMQWSEMKDQQNIAGQIKL